MEHEISNSKLRKLDERVAEFYKLSDMYLRSFNEYGRKIYKGELSNILNEIGNITPKLEFDSLILRNIKSNLRLNDLTLDYFADPNFSLSVKDFFNQIVGEGSYEFLEERVKSPPWKERWEYFIKTQERDYTRIDAFTKEAQDSAKEWLPKIKKDILEYGKSECLLPKDFDMTILLLPPREKGERSNWNSSTNVFNLGSYGFDFFLRGKEVIAIPVRAYNVSFHEVLGHGVHQINSKDIPLSTRFTEEIGTITPTKSVTEGFAINSEIDGFKFLRERLNYLGITKEDVDISQSAEELEQQTRYEYMYYALLKDRELREKDFDGYEHLLNLTKNPVVARGFKEWFKDGFIDKWREIGHTLGPLHYQKMVDKVKKEFGGGYIEKNKEKFHKASASGVWSWEVYPDAVCYFLREMEKN